MQRLLVRSVAVACFVALGLACGGSSKNFNDSCSSSSDCQSSYVCPTVGPMQGKCTISCTKDEQCAAIGAGVCTSDVCIPK